MTALGALEKITAVKMMVEITAVNEEGKAAERRGVEVIVMEADIPDLVYTFIAGRLKGHGA